MSAKNTCFPTPFSAFISMCLTHPPWGRPHLALYTSLWSGSVITDKRVIIHFPRTFVKSIAPLSVRTIDAMSSFRRVTIIFLYVHFGRKTHLELICSNNFGVYLLY